MEQTDQTHFWEAIYQSGRTGWDIGGASPPFVGLLHSAQRPVPGKMIVPGAGRGHDAVLFAQHGFDVTALDFAPSAIAATQAEAQRAGVTVQTLQADLFALPAALHGIFDYVLEYVCFCAINPHQRADYAQVVSDLLRPSGFFLALFFPTDRRAGGPPYAVDLGEVRSLFEPHFDLLWQRQPDDSIKPRLGKETMTLWQKK